MNQIRYYVAPPNQISQKIEKKKPKLEEYLRIRKEKHNNYITIVDITF